MLCLLYFVFTLCVGELGVKIVNGFQPEVDYLEKVGKNKLNFGYGVNFKFNGEIHNNLDRVWVVQKFNLPKELTNYVKGKKIGLDCSYKHIKLPGVLKGVDHDSNNRLTFIRTLCKQTEPLFESIEKGAFHYQQILEKLVNHDIPNALHRLPVVEEIRYKRAISTHNVSKHVQHDHLQADGMMVKHDQVYTNDSLADASREKRGIFSVIFPVFGKLATIAIEALGSHLQRKRKSAMAKALNRMEEQFLNKNQLHKIKQDFLMYGDYDVQSTDGMIRLLRNLNGRTTNLEDMLNGRDSKLASLYLRYNYRGTQIYAHQLNMYTNAMKERYLRVPENLISELRLLLRSIAILSRGYLPPQLFSPTDIVRISQAALQMVKQEHPDYVLAIPQASSYYDMRLVTFGIDEEDNLVVCFPIFVKDFSRKSMTLYQIETVPVPIVDKNLEANSYSQAIMNKPYIATNADYYIQIEIEELFMCKKISHIYFCEELFLVKHKTKHSCESALFYDLDSALVRQSCKFRYYYNATVIPSVLDGGSQIILANMLNEKRLICTYDQGLAKPLPSSPYVLVERTILCHCHIQSGLTYVLKNIGSCNTTVQPILYYTVNLAFINYFASFLSDKAEIPSTPELTETTLPLAMEDYSQDPNFNIYCQDTSQFPEYLDQLAHVHYQKQAFLANAKEFPIEGRAGMENNEVSQTPPSPSGNSFAFLFSVAYHIYVFVGTTISMIMLLPQIYMLVKQNKLRGLLAAVTMFKQATKASATPTVMPPTKVICHDQWVSFGLTLLTILGIIAYVVKHGRYLSLIYGKRFSNICKIYVLVSSQTHYVKLKIAEICGNPSLLSCNKMLEVDKVTMQRGCMWDNIHILWEDMVIRHAEVSVRVREHMSVPLIDRYRMRRLFAQAINYSLMVQQGDTWIKVPQETDRE